MIDVNFHLPAHHAVNRYFRSQDNDANGLITLLMHTAVDVLMQRYRAHTLSAQDIFELTAKHEELLQRVNAFGIDRAHIKGSRALPRRECRSLAAFFLQPVALGQGWMAGAESSYIEQGLYLRSVQMNFRPRKAFIGVGACSVILTRHVLSRVYERTEVDHTDFADLIHEHVDSLLKGIALAETCDLWIVTDDVRITAIPFAGGLLIVHTRPLFGEHPEGDLGFYYDIPKFKLVSPFINDGFILSGSGAGDRDKFLVTLAYSATTYINQVTLNDDEADYYHAYSALMESVGSADLAELAYQTFRPTHAHERSRRYQLQPTLQPKRDRVNALLRRGWLKTDRPLSVGCMLLPFEIANP